MCGRFGLFAAPEQIEARFQLATGAVAAAGWSDRYNIAPSHPVLAILGGAEGRRLQSLRWGLVPASTPPGRRSSGAPAKGREFINARVETAATKATFRESFRRARCLIPASGYYEWEGEETSGPDEPFRLTPPSARRPHWHARTDEAVFGMAGIVASWVADPDEAPVETCAILTAPASPAVAAVHPRMPLLVPRGREDAWLAVAPDADALTALIAEASALPWDTRVISDRVNSPRNEDASLLDPR